MVIAHAVINPTVGDFERAVLIRLRLTGIPYLRDGSPSAGQLYQNLLA